MSRWAGPIDFIDPGAGDAEPVSNWVTNGHLRAWHDMIVEKAERLRSIHSTLDEYLGDSDVTHVESAEQLREEYPIQWAAEELAKVINAMDRGHD